VILIDTSIWVDHLRSGDETVAALLGARNVLMHPFVVGELAVGNLSPREFVLSGLQALPEARMARHDEALDFLERHQLFGIGIGYVDVHLLASTQLTPGSALWTRDRRLSAAASRLGLAAYALH
jgi:predicted nucleic acid-binding protein